MYREARRLALEVRAKALDTEANPNLRIAAQKAGDLASVHLIFLGEWGEALKELGAAMTEAQKNANQPNILWLQDYQAWLHFQALDFRSALMLCQPALALLREPAPRAAPGGPTAYPGQLRGALICSGSASVALGDYARALEDFSAVNREMDRQRVIFDWYWRMPVAGGMTELWLATGDRTRAQLEAERLLELSLASANRHWQGLAWEVNSRVALENRNLPRARECIAAAVAAVQGFEVPLAAWRVHATAARIEEESGNVEAARSHRDVSRLTILQLANSLPEREPLRAIFLSAPAVVRILK
jgi:tetratricopeptide (TPR) repeat protein